MGVQGLKSFIDKNATLLEDFQLKDTKVIIDGNNLYHVLYYCLNISHHFGGDYDLFASRSRQYFKKLEACKVQPYVVFDGGYERDDRKLETTLRRAEDRLHLAGLISRGLRAKVLPVLTYETFRFVLEELHIPHATCPFEADREIAALARAWSCPVMSNDSDFFIFDLPGGFIPLDHMDVDISLSNRILTDDLEEYLPVKIYFAEKFSQKFHGVCTELLPLFATLVGNDYIDSKVFENFFSKLKTPQKRGKNKFLVPKRHSRMIGLLYWLESIQDCKTGIKEVLAVIPSKKCDRVESLIKKSIEMYATFQNDSLLNYFSSELIDSNREETSPILCAYDGDSLPAWFCSALRDSSVSVFLQNAVMLHRVILLCQVENMQSLSSYGCSQSIRQVIYGILFGEGRPKPECENVSKQTHVVEYNRKEKNMSKNFVEPFYSIPNVESLPTLHSLPHLYLAERRGIMNSVLECMDVGCELSSLQILSCLMRIWIKNATPKISQNHIKTVIVYTIFSSLQQEGIGTLENTEGTGNEDGLDISAALKISSKEEAIRARRNLDKYSRKPEYNAKNQLNADIIHGFSQFQACLLDIIHLNQLLMRPYGIPEPMAIYNGTFLYNFCKDLYQRHNVSLFIAEMLVKQSPLLGFFTEFEKSVFENMSEMDFAAGVSVKKKSKKKTGQKRSDTNIQEAAIGQYTSDDEGQSDRDDFVQAACETSNRFKFLALG